MTSRELACLLNKTGFSESFSCLTQLRVTLWGKKTTTAFIAKDQQEHMTSHAFVISSFRRREPKQWQQFSPRLIRRRIRAVQNASSGRIRLPHKNSKTLLPKDYFLLWKTLIMNRVHRIELSLNQLSHSPISNPQRHIQEIIFLYNDATDLQWALETLECDVRVYFLSSVWPYFLGNMHGFPQCRRWNNPQADMRESETQIPLFLSWAHNPSILNKEHLKTNDRGKNYLLAYLFIYFPLLCSWNIKEPIAKNSFLVKMFL